MAYKKWWTIKEADYYVVQTQDVKERLAEKIKTPKSKINLVTNGVGEHFKNTKIIAKNNNALKKLLMISVPAK